MEARTEIQAKFGLRNVEGLREEEEERKIEEAIEILKSRIARKRVEYFIHGPEDVKRYLRLSLAEEKIEYFGALLLNAQNGVMEDYRPFSGNVVSCAVYTATLMKRVLDKGASAIVVYHNHPSGMASPSRPDIVLTKIIFMACKTMQVELLDHLIIGEGEIPVYSFGENGEMRRIESSYSGYLKE